MGKRQDMTPVEDLKQNHLLFYGSRHLQYYHVFKLDLNRDFSAVEPARSKLSLKRCSHQPLSAAASSRRRRRSWNWMGRCNRHLRIRHKPKSKSRQSLLLSRMDRIDRQLKTSPNPFFDVHCKARKGGFPEEFAMGAVGSNFYLFGGYSWTGKDPFLRTGMVLPRDVYYIDATAESAETVKMSCQMNSGKRSPLAWTVSGKIYVLPGTFAFDEAPGLFECFDPKSGSWTILPSPPFLSQLSIPPDRCGLYPPPILVKNNILLGSNLVISTDRGKHYTFDTAQPRWRPVSLCFGSSELEFLPCPLSSVSVGDGLIYSNLDFRSFPPHDYRFLQSTFSCIESGEPPIVPAGPAERSFLKSLNIGNGDSYVCRFEYDAHDPQRLHLSIKPVRGIAGMVGWREYVKFGGPEVGLAGMGDGLVMYVMSGFDRFNIRMRSSFNLFRIQEEDEQYVVSSISSALLEPVAPSHFSSFVMKDGTFT